MKLYILYSNLFITYMKYTYIFYYIFFIIEILLAKYTDDFIQIFNV